MTISITPLPLADRLAGTDLLSRCTPGERRIVARHAQAMAVPAGTKLTRRGDPPANVFLVLDGAVLLRSASGEWGVGRGGSVGAWELWTGTPSPADALTTIVTELAVLGERAFRVLARELPSIRPDAPGDGAQAGASMP